jgi:predicted phosphoribosyltransferase
VAIAGSGDLEAPLRAQARAAGLDQAAIASGIAQTRTKVERRKRRLSAAGGAPDVAGRTVILVDDGLASGLTMEVAVDAVRACGAACVIVAIPTAHQGAVRRLEPRAEAIVCPNVRAKTPFAVAAAYDRWQDVPEVLADELLRPFRCHDRPWASH